MSMYGFIHSAKIPRAYARGSCSTPLQLPARFAGPVVVLYYIIYTLNTMKLMPSH